MSQMTDTLARLSNGGIYKQARTREEIKKELNSFFPYKLSEEAYEFYQWEGAPIGNRSPDDWDGCLNDTSTYNCRLDGFSLNIKEDYIHFLSIEEAEYFYGDSLYNLKSFPFAYNEYYFLLITGSEHEVKTSPIVKRKNIKEKLFFPRLTNTAVCSQIEDNKEL